MFPRSKNFNPRHRNRGVSLIEVMISVLVMGIGMLGIAAMQATALRNSQSALERSQAVIQSYSILDAMRANIAIARTGGYDMAMSCAPPTGSSLAASDQANWINSLQGTGGIGASSCGAISCDTNRCTVTVRWDDSRASGGSATQSFVTVTRL